jgi:hypothetical protein
MRAARNHDLIVMWRVLLTSRYGSRKVSVQSFRTSSGSLAIFSATAAPLKCTCWPHQRNSLARPKSTVRIRSAVPLITTRSRTSQKAGNRPEAYSVLPFFPPFNAVNADLMQIKAIISAWAYTLRFRKTSKAIDHAPALHAENCA